MGLIKLCLENTYTSLKDNAHVAFPVHVLWLSFTVERRSCSVDHRHTLLEFLPVGGAEANNEDIEDGADKNNSQSRSTSLEFVLHEQLICHAYGMRTQKMLITVLEKR